MRSSYRYALEQAANEAYGHRDLLDPFTPTITPIYRTPPEGPALAWAKDWENIPPSFLMAWEAEARRVNLERFKPLWDKDTIHYKQFDGWLIKRLPEHRTSEWYQKVYQDNLDNLIKAMQSSKSYMAALELWKKYTYTPEPGVHVSGDYLDQFDLIPHQGKSVKLPTKKPQPLLPSLRRLW